MAKAVRPAPAPAGNRPAQPRPTVPARKPSSPAPAAAGGAGRGRFGRFGSLRPQSLQQAPTANFFRESLSELKKVHWPTREQTIQMTAIVIVSCLATGLVLGGLDFVFARVIGLLVGAQ